MKILAAVLLSLSLGASCDRRPPEKKAQQTPATRGRKTVFERFEGLSLAGNSLKTNQTYSLSFDVFFREHVHKPVVSLVSYDDVPCEITVSPFLKLDYQAGDQERVTCTIKPLKMGKGTLRVSPFETDVEGDTWRLDGGEIFPIKVED